MHLIDKRVGMAGTSAIVGGAVPIATGAALAAQMKGETARRGRVPRRRDDRGRRDVGEPELRRAQASCRSIFFCENNFYSVQSPLATRQPAAASSTSGRPRTRCRPSTSTARTCWRSTTRSKRRSRARAPAAARRSSRRRSTGSARTAASGDDSTDRLPRRGGTRRVGGRSIRSRCSASTSTRPGLLDADAIAAMEDEIGARDRRGVRVRARQPEPDGSGPVPHMCTPTRRGSLNAVG